MDKEIKPKHEAIGRLQASLKEMKNTVLEIALKKKKAYWWLDLIDGKQRDLSPVEQARAAEIAQITNGHRRCWRMPSAHASYARKPSSLYPTNHPTQGSLVVPEKSAISAAAQARHVKTRTPAMYLLWRLYFMRSHFSCVQVLVRLSIMPSLVLFLGLPFLR